MHVGQHIRITVHGISEDFVIAEIRETAVYVRQLAAAPAFVELNLNDGNLSVPTMPDAVIEIVPALTGNTNINIMILSKLGRKGLMIMAAIDATIQTLYQRDELWYAKTEADFGGEILQHKPQDMSAREFYEMYDDIKRRGGTEVLVAAAENGNSAVLRGAIALGARVNAPHGLGHTALMSAAEFGDVGNVEYLIRMGAKVNASDFRGNTPLLYAVSRGHLGVVQELLRAGADVNAANNSQSTALILAARYRHLDIVKELIRAGADVNRVDSDGNTALMRAAKTNSVDIVNELVQAGAR